MHNLRKMGIETLTTSHLGGMVYQTRQGMVSRLEVGLILSQAKFGVHANT